MWLLHNESTIVNVHCMVSLFVDPVLVWLPNTSKETHFLLSVLHSYTILGTDQSYSSLDLHTWYTHLSHLLVTLAEQFLFWQRLFFMLYSSGIVKVISACYKQCIEVWWCDQLFPLYWLPYRPKETLSSNSTEFSVWTLWVLWLLLMRVWANYCLV